MLIDWFIGEGGNDCEGYVWVDWVVYSIYIFRGFRCLLGNIGYILGYIRLY